MSITIIKNNVKVPFKCIVEMVLERPELEELYEDVLKKKDQVNLHPLRFDGTDYFRYVLLIIKKYADGDIVLHDDEWDWAYRFHDTLVDYVTSPRHKLKLKPIKDDNN